MTSRGRDRSRRGGPWLAGIAAALLLLGGEALAQFCPGGTTYFGENFALPSCTVGSCWAATSFAGSTAVTPGEYPSTNYACATTAPAAGALENTRYAYDGNRNLTSSTDPPGRTTTNAYDALNRLVQVLDPNAGATAYLYDAANNLTRLTDANGNATSYVYGGLGELLTQVSPATGTTSHSYNPAGNLATRTDARGASATYSYDSLNRVTQILYSKSGTPNETHSFTYDLGANAKGRLSQVSDPAATTAWSYTSQGRLASKSQTVGAVTLTVSYGYNAAGQLTSLTTPSGQQLSFGYTNNRVSSITVNGQALLSAAEPEPFGALAGWRWGNAMEQYRDHDFDGRLATWEFRNGLSLLRKDLSFDAAGRVLAINDPLNGAASQAFAYDALDRLTVAQTGSPVAHTRQFGYDALGNRQSVTGSGNNANLYYGAGNRLLAFIGSIAPGYLNGASTLAYTYNNANRLVAVQRNGAALAAYTVNALGQRVSKTVGGVTTLFVYDEQGHLLGEYEGSGRLIQETVWLEELPVATLRPQPGSTSTPVAIDLYYVHADHLGSPRAVTRPSDNALVWRWDNLDPFGADAPDENPSGAGSFAYALRFPGQYYDAETGTHYNYFRDYDPNLGRYVESDPIGIEGGVNTYAYVNGAPLSAIDPRGLATCVYSVCSGEMTCTRNGSERIAFRGIFASGNNSMPGCKNNSQCEQLRNIGPIPRGCWLWNGGATSKPGGRTLVPLPGTKDWGRDMFRTHICANPFGPSVQLPYCSDGCVTGTSATIGALNSILDSEPNSVLCVIGC